jgi:hypothetical protein
MADYFSVIAKAVSALDLNTEKARLRLYERARTALRSEMHSAYPPFRRSEIAAAEMSLEMAIEAVEAEATCDQNARLATLSTSSLRARVSVMPSLPANQNGDARRSLATLWAGRQVRLPRSEPFRSVGPHTIVPTPPILGRCG